MTITTVPSTVFSDPRWRHRASQPTEPSLGLTERDRQLLTLASQGLTNAQVARTLGISVRSATGAYARLFTRMRAENRTHAVAMALRAQAIQ